MQYITKSNDRNSAAHLIDEIEMSKFECEYPDNKQFRLERNMQEDCKGLPINRSALLPMNGRYNYDIAQWEIASWRTGI